MGSPVPNATKLKLHDVQIPYLFIICLTVSTFDAEDEIFGSGRLLRTSLVDTTLRLSTENQNRPCKIEGMKYTTLLMDVIIDVYVCTEIN